MNGYFTRSPNRHREKVGASEAEGGGVGPRALIRQASSIRRVLAAPPSTSPPAECRLYMGQAAAAGNPAGRARHRGTFLSAAGAGGGLHLSSLVLSSICMRSTRSVSLFLFYIYNRLILYVIYLRKCGVAGYSYVRDEAAYCPRSD